MKTKIIAHRGAHEDVAENTIEAFDRALILGADGLELDIHYAKDGEIMVYHDFELNRLTSKSGMLSDYTKEELKDLTLKGNTKIPTLTEVLMLISRHQKHRTEPILLNVELKAGSRIYPNIEERTVALCEQYLERENLIYSSFDHHALVKLKLISEDILTGVLTASSVYEPWMYLNRLKADFYHPNFMTMDSDDLQSLMAAGLKVNPYTVNDETIAKSLFQVGIHGLITDYPEKMLKLRRSL